MQQCQKRWAGLPVGPPELVFARGTVFTATAHAKRRWATERFGRYFGEESAAGVVPARVQLQHGQLQELLHGQHRREYGPEGGLQHLVCESMHTTRQQNSGYLLLQPELVRLPGRCYGCHCKDRRCTTRTDVLLRSVHTEGVQARNWRQDIASLPGVYTEPKHQHHQFHCGREKHFTELQRIHQHWIDCRCSQHRRFFDPFGRYEQYNGNSSLGDASSYCSCSDDDDDNACRFHDRNNNDGCRQAKPHLSYSSEQEPQHSCCCQSLRLLPLKDSRFVLYSMPLHPDEICERTPYEQFQRFRRGVTWTPRRFELLDIYIEPFSIEFLMHGGTDDYRLTMNYFPTHTNPNRDCVLGCSCPDAYPGLCKHICWLLFKVLGHSEMDVFWTHRVPKALVAELLRSSQARQELVEGPGRRRPDSFQAIHDRELSFASWTPPKPLFHEPQNWPLTNTDCSVCFEEMQKETARQCPACSNCFHDDCIAKWFLHKRSCPLCRKQFVRN